MSDFVIKVAEFLGVSFRLVGHYTTLSREVGLKRPKTKTCRHSRRCRCAGFPASIIGLRAFGIELDRGPMSSLVRSGHVQRKSRRPLYPRQRKLIPPEVLKSPR